MKFARVEIVCPIWGTAATDLILVSSFKPSSGAEIDSPRTGGKYLLAEGAATTVVDLDESKKILLTSWLVEQRLLDFPCPKICDTTMEMVANRQPLKASERADNLLRYLEFKGATFGETVEFNSFDNYDAPKIMQELLAWTASSQLSEVIKFAEYCSKQKWIEHNTKPVSSPKDIVHELMLLPPGYTQIGK